MNEMFNWLEGRVSHKMCTHNNIILASTHTHTNRHKHTSTFLLIENASVSMLYDTMAELVEFLELNEIVYMKCE